MCPLVNKKANINDKYVYYALLDSCYNICYSYIDGETFDVKHIDMKYICLCFGNILPINVAFWAHI
jgi:hypothetical protein